jgi:hypothetical protein
MSEFRDHRWRHEHALVESRQQVFAVDLDEVVERDVSATTTIMGGGGP